MKKNKHVIQFLAKFFLVYFSLLGIYNFYLKNTQQTEDIYSSLACCADYQSVSDNIFCSICWPYGNEHEVCKMDHIKANEGGMAHLNACS